MDIMLIALAAIAPSLLLWGLLGSAFLNGIPRRAARVAEVQGWAAFALSALAGVAWLAGGRRGLSYGAGEDPWFGLRLDAVSLPLLLLATFLAAIILRFSRNYLDGDPNHGRFTKWMCLTLGSVVALVSAPGLAQFLVAWIATSLGLHKLLVFFPQRHGTLFSARKKFLVSRIADLGLAVAFASLYWDAGAQSFEALIPLIQQGSFAAAPFVPWLIAASAILKSAQFPFHTWLPDTMGTPTPVSALMHAGIINAGGILVIRFAPLFQANPAPLYLLALCGAVTAAMASLVMLSQTSIKRSLAYSTIAQMGFMLMQCGFGAFHLALLHIVAHSLYKAHTFLSSGAAAQAIQARQAGSLATGGLARNAAVPVAAGFAIVALSLWLAGFSLDDKPGALVFAAALAAALTQFLSQSPLRHPFAAALLASAIGGLYLALAELSAWWLQPMTPIAALSHPLFDASVAAFILIVFLFSIHLQRSALGRASAPWAHRLYVHALNGFYLNTLANRAIRFLRLHPDEA